MYITPTPCVVLGGLMAPFVHFRGQADDSLRCCLFVQRCRDDYRVRH